MNDIGDLSTTTQKQKWFVFNKLLRMHDNTTNAKIYTYTYNANIGMTSQTDFNGIMTHYKYDDSGRLTTELDHDMNIINKYEYNYINNTNE
jgi:YD repeat-containing protein